MGKKEQFFPIAESKFVEQQKCIETIATELGNSVSTKTLHKWKKEGDWENKRERFLAANTSTSAALIELTNLMTLDALETYKKTGEKPDKETLNFIKSVIPRIMQAKNVETAINNEQQENIPKNTDETLLKNAFNLLETI